MIADDTDADDSTDPKPPSESDRRERRRVHISSNVAINDIAELTTGAGTDLSVGGMYVISSHHLGEGTLVDLAFTLEEIDREFRLRGAIRWHQQQPVGDEDRHALGIEFLDLDPEDERALEEFVDRYDPVSDEESDVGDERSDGERVPVSTRVTLKTVSNLTMALGSDVSAGGIYVVASEQYAIGTTMDLEFTVGEVAREFRALGEIRWRQPHRVGDEQWYGHGVEFVDLDPEDRRLLEEFTDERSPVDPEERKDEG